MCRIKYPVIVTDMYCMPNYSSGQKATMMSSHRKEARYELASLLTQERFDEAVRLADAYLLSEVIHPEDHAFVIEIAFAAETLPQENGN